MADADYETFFIDDARLRIPLVGLNRGVRGRLTDGGYEHFERDLARAHLRPGDRLLDLGSGAGLVAIIAARIIGGTNVVTVEPNPEMHHCLRRNLRDNAGREVRLIKAAVVPDDFPDKTVTLHLRSGFWSATTKSDAGPCMRPVEVRAKRFRQLLRSVRPTAITMDIEGAEAALLTKRLPDHVRLIVTELHPHLYGENTRDEIIASLKLQGFRNLNKKKTEDVYAFGRAVAAQDPT